VLVPDVAGTVVTMTKVFMSVTVEVIVVSVDPIGVEVRVSVGVIVTVVWNKTMVKARAVPRSGNASIYSPGAI